jgi:hypothetical protein
MQLGIPVAVLARGGSHHHSWRYFWERVVRVTGTAAHVKLEVAGGTLRSGHLFLTSFRGTRGLRGHASSRGRKMSYAAGSVCSVRFFF